MNGAGSDSANAWDFVVPAIPQAFNIGSGWFTEYVSESEAGEVRGTTHSVRSGQGENEQQ